MKGINKGYFIKSLLLSLAFLAAILTLPLQSVFASETTSSTADEDHLLAEIQERGVIRMGTASGYAPYEFTILENGENKVVGVDVFLGEQIAEDLGVKLEVVDMEFGSLITSLETGSIDIIIAGMTATEERDKSIDFSTPYEVSSQDIVIREEDKDNIVDYTSFHNGEYIMGVSENTLQETYIQQYIDNPEVVTMRKSADAVSALLAGQADGVLLDASVAGAFAAEHDGLTTVTSGMDVEEQGKSVGLSENQPSLLEAINNTVANVDAENLIEIWTEESYDIITDNSNSENGWMAYWPYFWDGIKTTLFISAVSIVFGAILGVFLALLRISGNPILSGLATAYVEFVRGTPLMIQVLFMFLGVGGIFGWSTITAGLVAVSLNSGAYICEIIRGGIQAVDKGQTEAASSLGLNYWTAMRKVVFPQSLRSIWPSLGNEFITLIKESSIVSTIGVAELTFQTRAVTSLTYEGIIPLIISMILYFIITFTLSKLLNMYERKMNKKYI